MAQRVVVAITGLPGAGKSLAADFFVSKGFQFIRFGQVTLDEIKRRKLELNEKNERIIREGLRKKHGMGAFAKLILPKVEKMLKKGNVIADGLYSFEEYELFKKAFNDRFMLLAIYASPQTRYRRLSNRKLKKTDKALRNRPFTIQEARSRDLAELKNLNKGPAIALADYTIVNEGTIALFKKDLDKIYWTIRRSNA